MLVIVVQDVVFGSGPLLDGLGFMALAVLSAGLGVRQLRVAWR